MTNTYTNAKFWKCALQVNPYSYIQYRGSEHNMTEEQYNEALLKTALENDIKVIGLADHGNISGVDAIRSLMNEHKIIVFPGFEIATTEKAHFVCLFPEDTTRDQLHRYLGALDLTDPEDGIPPSKLGGNALLAKVEELGGFVYAAHATDESGILRQKLLHVWQDPRLKAVQIAATLGDLKNEYEQGYRQILLNKNPDYKRDIPVGLINAKDVATPTDLANPKASCLIKMTIPCFSSFKLAFQDPECRVRLNSDISQKYFSCIESLKVTGGYLDGIYINFSEHLNSVIGGRGTGKSTLLECLRFVLDLQPIGKNARKQHDEIMKENLGKCKARVEIVIRSLKMNGRRFTIARRYGESASVKDEDGKPSSFTPSDLLPEIEIYGQNEIYEIAQDKTSQRQLLSRFLESNQIANESKIQQARSKLSENRNKLIEAQKNVSSMEDEVAKLPKLEEQVGQFKSLGLEQKLKIIPLLETEKRLIKRALEEEGTNLDQAFKAVRDCLPDTTFLSESSLSSLPHADDLRKIREELNKLQGEAEILLTQWHTKYAAVKDNILKLGQELTTGILKEEELLEKTFKDLPSCEGKSGREIGNEFQRLMKEIEQIRPKQTLIATRQQLVSELKQQRSLILEDLSESLAERSAQFLRSLNKLNKRLEGKLKLNIQTEADRTPLIQFLLNCKLEGVAEGRLAWIKDAEPFSVVRLAELIRSGPKALRESNWGMTPTVAEAISRLDPGQVLELEEIELPDMISIELNTAHEGQENFRPLDKLSTGQQCTAILHLLLLQNLDPLIMDQPEDNLDNAFIADRIVAELRSAKLSRQFIFATHNANIPVFGDAEWIGVFEAFEGQAKMPFESQGAIDVEKVREMSATILEGGKIRMGDRSELASREQQARLFASGGLLHVEVLPVAGTSLSSIDKTRLDFYLRTILKDPEIPMSDSEWVDRLSGLGLMTEDSLGNKVCSVAGLICFGIKPRRYLRQAGLRVMCFSGIDKDYQSLLDVILDAPLVGRFEVTETGQRQLVDQGLLEKFSSAIEPFVTQEANSIDENMRRIKTDFYPWDAVRETVINALVHRDWTRSVDVEVTNYSDRLEVISPGKLQNSMTVTKMKAGQRSPRNTLIMEIMRDYGYVEFRGMGVRTKVIPLMRKFNNIDPVFEATDDYLKTVLFRNH